MTRLDPSNEPAREPAYRAAHRQLYDRIGNQDGCITWLLVELRALQKRVAKLEQHSADTASWKLKAAYEATDDSGTGATK